MSLETDIALLSRVRLFEGFGVEHLRLLAFGAETRRFVEGTRIYREGSLADGGYVIVRGTVDLISGRNDDVIETHGPASLIAELALISEVEHAASAISRDNIEVLKISRALFRRMLTEYPELAVMLEARLMRSVEEFMSRLAVLRAKLNHASKTTARRDEARRTSRTRDASR